MKNKALVFLNRYKFCALAGVLLVLGLEIVLSFFHDVILIDGEMLDFSAGDIYLIYFLPFVSVLHGVLSCVSMKKVFMPSLVFSITVWIVLLIMNLNSVDSVAYIFSIFALVWPGVAFAFSFVFSLITKFIITIKEVK